MEQLLQVYRAHEARLEALFWVRTQLEEMANRMRKIRKDRLPRGAESSFWGSLAGVTQEIEACWHVLARLEKDGRLQRAIAVQ